MNKGVVLVVDDEAQIRDILGFYLKRAGYHVLLSENGVQALEQMALFPEVKSEGISTRNTPRGSRSQFGVTIRWPGTGEGET